MDPLTNVADVLGVWTRILLFCLFAGPIIVTFGRPLVAAASKALEAFLNALLE